MSDSAALFLSSDQATLPFDNFDLAPCSPDLGQPSPASPRIPGLSKYVELLGPAVHPLKSSETLGSTVKLPSNICLASATSDWRDTTAAGIVLPVAVRDGLSSGLSAWINKRFPWADLQFSQACRDGSISVGVLVPFHGSRKAGTVELAFAVTRERYYDATSPNTLAALFRHVRRWALVTSPRVVAIPALGVVNDCNDWDSVLQLAAQYLGGLDTEFVMYPPTDLECNHLLAGSARTRGCGRPSRQPARGNLQSCAQVLR